MAPKLGSITHYADKRISLPGAMPQAILMSPRWGLPGAGLPGAGLTWGDAPGYINVAPLGL